MALCVNEIQNNTEIKSLKNTCLNVQTKHIYTLALVYNFIQSNLRYYDSMQSGQLRVRGLVKGLTSISWRCWGLKQ